MSESAVDWTRLMNEANSDGNFVFVYCNTLYYQNYEVIIIDQMDYQRKCRRT